MFNIRVAKLRDRLRDFRPVSRILNVTNKLHATQLKHARDRLGPHKTNRKEIEEGDIDEHVESPLQKAKVIVPIVIVATPSPR
jgi:hypothetical protein